MIYENGTESNVLLRSLAANLYRTGSGGKMITDNIDNLIDGVEEEDISSGYIYVYDHYQIIHKFKKLITYIKLV